jgi:hypothetical protein
LVGLAGSIHLHFCHEHLNYQLKKTLRDLIKSIWAIILSAPETWMTTKEEDMPENRLPKEFKSIAEIQDFWDTHSSADYWDEMEDVDLQHSPVLQAKLELKKLYRLLNFFVRPN